MQIITNKLINMMQLVESRCSLKYLFKFAHTLYISFSELKLLYFLAFSTLMHELEIAEFMFYGCSTFSSSSALATQVIRSNGMAELPILSHI